jgi:hypothetical protein
VLITVLVALAVGEAAPALGDSSALRTVQEPVPQRVAMAAAVRRACFHVMRSPNAQAHPLYVLCELPPPDDATRADWLNLNRANVPTPAVIQATADSLDDAVWVAERGTVQQFEPTSGGVVAAGIPSLPTTSSVLWGITDFLVTRGREQLEVYVVARVGQRVCAQNAAGPLLVATCELVRPEGGASATIPGTAALRDAARHDLNRLPGTLTDFAIRRQQAWPDSAAADAAAVARLAGYFIGGLLDGEDPLRAYIAIANLQPVATPRFPFSERATPAAVNVYTLASLLSTLEQDSVARQQNWPQGNPGLRLGHLYATKALLVNATHGAPHPWPGTAGLASVCGAGSGVVCGAILTAALRAPAFLSASDSLRVRTTRFAAAEGDSSRVLAAASMLSAAVDLLQVTVDVGGDRPSYRKVMLSLHGVADVTRDLATRQYSAAVRRSFGLVDSLQLGAHLPAEGARILSFASDIAHADDAEGVEDALDNFVGRTTFLNKRDPDAGWYVYLNAYVGAAAGREGACKGARTCDEESRFAGAYAPLGVEVGHAVDWKYSSWLIRSVGLFVQAVDLGTLASWRLGNEENVSSAPTISARQVFAPGAHLVFGIRRLPLSVGIGGSLAPKLRRITTDNGIEERNAVRPLSIFAAVDIPLYP